jgi:hypothetical protein
MPLEQVPRDRALSKTEFHRRLRNWIESTDDATVGAEGVHPRTNWVHVYDGSDIFDLHADTRREFVEKYLQIVAIHGDDLQWELTESQRGKMSAVVYGPNKIREKSFYLYSVTT